MAKGIVISERDGSELIGCHGTRAVVDARPTGLLRNVICAETNIVRVLCSDLRAAERRGLSVAAREHSPS
jgi:hypothetical protein